MRVFSSLPCGVIVCTGLPWPLTFHMVRVPSEWLQMNCLPSWCQATEWMAWERKGRAGRTVVQQDDNIMCHRVSRATRLLHYRTRTVPAASQWLKHPWIWTREQMAIKIYECPDFRACSHVGGHFYVTHFLDTKWGKKRNACGKILLARIYTNEFHFIKDTSPLEERHILNIPNN